MTSNSKSEKILAHAIASVNLYRNTPQLIKTRVDNGQFFIKLELLDRKCAPRKLTYFCSTVEDAKAVTSALAEIYSVPVLVESE